MAYDRVLPVLNFPITFKQMVSLKKMSAMFRGRQKGVIFAMSWDASGAFFPELEGF